MSGVAQRYWTASTLQGRRWMMERRLEAVEENNVDKLQQLLTAQGRTKPRELTSALEIALRKRSDKYTDCVALLLQYGADPNGTNGSGTPFLHLAVDAGCSKIASALLLHKCLLQQGREDGASALHRAAWRGHVPCLELLLDAGADVNARDAMGRTPLVTAAQGNNTACATILINNGCDVNLLDGNGMSVIAWGAHYGNLDLVSMGSINAQMDVLNAQDPKGRAPLHVAVLNKHSIIIQHLLDNGANVNLRDFKGRTAVNIAAGQQNSDCVYMMISTGCDVNIGDINLTTPLISLLGFSDLVIELINAGAEPNVITKQNLTPLWISCRNNYIISTKVLLQANANPGVLGGWDNSKFPLQMALYGGFISIVKMLFTACVAMGTDITWLPGYLRDDNFQQQVQTNEDVATAITWINDVVNIHPTSQAKSLQSLCRIFVRNYLGSRRLFQNIGRLHLPSRMKQYLRLADLDDYI